MPSIAPPPPDNRPRDYEVVDDSVSGIESRDIFLREAERIKRSQTSSQLLTNLAQIDSWIASLSNLTSLANNRNLEQSPAPNEIAVRNATEILKSIRFSSTMPEKVHPSAEGGIALVYVGTGKNRAIVEALNNEEAYALFYSIDGNALTVDWPSRNMDAQQKIVAQLETHLRGSDFATIK